jgi:type II secretory pathway pseudopilin PulG
MSRPRIRLRAERGITIIETTVMLALLFVLAGAMSPIVSESVTTARVVKAKNDAAMIAMAIINLQKDLGGDALSFGGAVAPMGIGLTPAETSSLPDVLASAGAPPAAAESEEDMLEAAEAGPLLSQLRPPHGGSGRGAAEHPVELLRAERRRWREVRAGALEDHLLTNRRGYRYRRPGEYGGWNGPYISAPTRGDAWGNQFLVNSAWLDGGSTAADEYGRPRRAVFVVSAGANGVIETPFEQPITDARAFGDDIVVRIQ